MAAAEAGQFTRMKSANPEERQAFVASVTHIMRSEMGVPDISRDCLEHGGYRSIVFGYLGDIATAHASTLGNEPPDFVNRQVNTQTMLDDIRRQSERLRSTRDRTHCDAEQMGRVVPHPFKAALLQLAEEFSKANDAYVRGERERRRIAYRTAMAKQQEEQRQRDSQVRAAEQSRIDAEAARIKADEERRKQKEKQRIGG